MSFSSWMTELRTHEHHHHQLTTESSSLVSSAASSWAGTDCDSDSDNEFGNREFFGDYKNRKSVARKLMAQRTTPIAIPHATHTAHSRASFEFVESPVHRETGDYDCHDTMGAMDINEEDLMLFGNLAYFRTQHGAKSGMNYGQRTAAPSALSSTTSSMEDEDIFDMEL